jgi:hypothetical protein
VQHHQYGQSELHRHLRSGRGSIYLFEGALDAQRRRQHEQLLGAMKSAQPSLSSKEPKVVFLCRIWGARIAFMRFQDWSPHAESAVRGATRITHLQKGASSFTKNAPRHDVYVGICLNIRRFPSLFACRPVCVRARVTGPGAHCDQHGSAATRMDVHPTAGEVAASRVAQEPAAAQKSSSSALKLMVLPSATGTRSLVARAAARRALSVRRALP